MRVIASMAMSADGFIDDNSPTRLVLSDQADWQEVYDLRKGCDAILVGAETIRRDNPSLKFTDTKVIISGSCCIPTDAQIFESGRVIIFTESENYNKSLKADIVVMPHITAKLVCCELEKRGISRLLIEGGARTMQMFFEENCIDEYREAVAPIKIGEGVQGAKFKVQGISKSIRKIGQMVVSEYIIHYDYDLIYLQQAINLSRLCTPSNSAYSVGCVIVTARGEKFTGYTHQTASHNHAEEEALTAALSAGVDLKGAIAYTSLEPCSVRKSKPVSCSELLIKYGFSRVVYAASEPDCFVVCEGANNLRKAGVKVRQIKELEQQVFDINKHIIT